jgi:hypothetical protein
MTRLLAQMEEEEDEPLPFSPKSASSLARRCPK